MDWELTFLDYLQTLHSDFLDRLMVFFTSLANSGIFWILLTLAFILFGRQEKKRWGLHMLLALILSFITVNLFLKPVVDRVRPFTFRPALELLVSLPRDASFPSGHSSISFAGAMSLYFCSKKWGRPALVLAAVIAFSRLYLYVHFPTDVLFGTAMGILCALISKKCFEHFGNRNKALENERGKRG